MNIRYKFSVLDYICTLKSFQRISQTTLVYFKFFNGMTFKTEKKEFRGALIGILMRHPFFLYMVRHLNKFIANPLFWMTHTHTSFRIGNILDPPFNVFFFS